MATPLTSKPLTKKQTAFRDAILAGYGPSKAYRMAFNVQKMSPKFVSNEAQRLLKHPKITHALAHAYHGGKVPAIIVPPLSPAVRLSMEERLEELRCAARLNPADCFDELNHFKSIRDMPEHVQRAIAGFEVDPLSFVIKVKFIDKISAIMSYSKLAGDIPREKGPMVPQARRQFDLSKLTDDELKEHIRLRKKAMVASEEQT